MTDSLLPCREEFEKWLAKSYRDPIPEYAKDEARIMHDNWWVVWQAAWGISPNSCANGCRQKHYMGDLTVDEFNNKYGCEL